MDQNGRVRAWLFMAVGDDRGHRGNLGYDDQYDSYYSWDSRVPNSKAIQVGDVVVVWDKNRLLGASVVEAIESGPAKKTLNLCTRCKASRISARTTVMPRFRCNRCRHEFDLPEVVLVDVQAYRARFDAAWTPLEGVLSASELRAAASSPRDFNSMRALEWDRFAAAINARVGSAALRRVGMRAVDVAWPAAERVALEVPQGFREALVRVRRGQAKFRESLLRTQGSNCAFTGTAPERVLEAGHLYSYAKLGTHFEHGGLMLRRDIHRLFDDGSLAVNPESLRIDVSPALAVYPQYARLHNEALRAKLRSRQQDWLAEHWLEHRQPTASTQESSKPRIRASEAARQNL